MTTEETQQETLPKESKLMQALDRLESKQSGSGSSEAPPKVAAVDPLTSSPPPETKGPPVPQEQRDSGSPREQSLIEKLSAIEPPEPLPPAPQEEHEDDVEEPPYPQKGKWSETLAEFKTKIRKVEGEKRKELERQLHDLQTQAKSSGGSQAELEELRSQRDYLDSELAKVRLEKTYAFRREIEEPATNLIEKIEKISGPKGKDLVESLKKAWSQGTLDFLTVPDVDSALAQANSVQRTAVAKYLTDLVELADTRRTRLGNAQTLVTSAEQQDKSDYSSAQMAVLAETRAEVTRYLQDGAAEIREMPQFKKNAAFAARLYDRMQAIDQGNTLKNAADQILAAVVYEHYLEAFKAENTALRARLANYEKGDRIPGNATSSPSAQAPAGNRLVAKLDEFMAQR